MHSLLVYLCLGLVTAAPALDLDVSTSSGVISGFLQSNVRQFLGIPYAKPPVGDLRWEPPQALLTPKKRISAKKLPPSCPQRLTTLDNSLFKNDLLEFNLQGLNVTGKTSEDCLTLSIWAPKEPRKPLPVFVWIFGGGWYTGGTDTPYQIPTQWVERTQEHIVVSLNQRLNIFGWPNAPGLKEQNLGILDLRLAIEWVAKNIQAFGGDPKKITFFGQSSGGQSIDIYSYAFYKDPIISGMILQSGTAAIPLYSADIAQNNFTFVASELGCKDVDPLKRLACFRKVPEKAISDYLFQDLDNGQRTGLIFTPMPDERTHFANYTSRGNRLARIPAIIGNTANEGAIFLPYPVTDPDGGVDLVEAEQTASVWFACPTKQTIGLREVAGRTTFRYQYSGNFSNIAPRKWQGAYHQSDLPLIFGTYNNYRGVAPRLETITSEAMQDLWLAFGRDGAKGLQQKGWQPYSSKKDTIINFGNKTAVSYITSKDLASKCVD